MKVFKIVATNEPEVFEYDIDDKQGIFFVLEDDEEKAIAQFKKTYPHWRDGISDISERNQGVIYSDIWIP